MTSKAQTVPPAHRPPTAPSSRQILNHALIGFRKKLAVLSITSLTTACSEVAVLSTILATVSTLTQSEDKTFSGKLPWSEQSFTISLPTMLWLCLVLTALRAISQCASVYASARIATSYEALRRRRLFTAFLGASWDCQSRESAGRMQLLMTRNMEAASKALANISLGVTSLINFVILVASAFYIDWIGAVVAVIVAIVLFVGIRPITKWAQSHARKKLSIQARFVNVLSQGIGLVRELRVFQVADYFNRYLGDLVGKYRRHRLGQHALSGLVPVVHQNASLLIVIGGLAFTYAWNVGNLASLSLVVLLLLRAMTHGQNLQVFHHAVLEGVPYLEELQAAEAEYLAERAPTDGEPITQIESLAMDCVRFAYHPGDVVLDDVTFRAERGEMIGIVGPSGSGKTTLMQLLLRLRDPQQGRFLVNDRPASEFAPDSWYDRTAFVPQEAVLFNESIEECIRFHRPRIDGPQVREAAAQAGVHDEIIAFPDGYNTLAGERGASLSGGQRQRVCIARALAGSPDVIIFDEPTSALDVHSETRVLETLAALKGRVTVFIIAHRLSTLNICDKVMVLRHGRIQAFDAPGALAEHDPYYAEALRLAQVQ